MYFKYQSQGKQGPNVKNGRRLLYLASRCSLLKDAKNISWVTAQPWEPQSRLALLLSGCVAQALYNFFEPQSTYKMGMSGD